VGIEFAVHLISPADSIALVSSLPPKMQLRGRVLWPRCGQLPRARERERNDTLPRRPTLKSLRGPQRTQDSEYSITGHLRTGTNLYGYGVNQALTHSATAATLSSRQIEARNSALYAHRSGSGRHSCCWMERCSNEESAGPPLNIFPGAREGGTSLPGRSSL
jgi:hypothetical protein